MTAWRLDVLGGAWLRGRGDVFLERKTAALLTYLALEGPTRRSQLTELLWPETRETAARNNLVHLLRKLKAAAGAELVEGGEVLVRTETLGVDVLAARDAFLRGEHGDLLRFSGELLQGLTYDDCPDLDDWVRSWRDRFLEWRRVALRADERRLEDEERFDEALPHALALIDLDPVSEDAWRRVMRLHYLRGDRPAALLAYQACRDALQRELGVEPLPETSELARQVERGQVPSVTVPSAPLPLAVLRPPVLVGREREWAEMERAWQAGKVIYLQGPPGVGKTRLARDFAASKGAFVVNEGRPGDARHPKSSSMRAFQNMYARVRGLDVPDWIKLEMSRYIPDFKNEGFSAPSITDATDLLRFRQAMTEFLRLISRDLQSTIIDDFQYFDAASLEDGAYMFAHGTVSGEDQHAAAPLICTFRKGELAPENEAIMRDTIEAGQSVLIDLQPLDDVHVGTLLDSLDVTVSDDVRRGVARYSGGNPLFLLETVKHLIETRQLNETFPERLPPPKKVGDVLARRLERLSAPALQAARAAAVLQSDFSVETVAETLGAGLLDTMNAWEELEAAQIVSGERFSHDLVYEAIEASLSPTVRQLLNRSAAKVLERAGAPAARVAGHWRAGQKPRLLAEWLLRAAEDAFDAYQLPDAARFFEEAAETFELLGEHSRAREALARRESTLQVRSTADV